jgi:hypothetical protein
MLQAIAMLSTICIAVLLESFKPNEEVDETGVDEDDRISISFQVPEVDTSAAGPTTLNSGDELEQLQLELAIKRSTLEY